MLDYLSSGVSAVFDSVFLMGNHEWTLLDFLETGRSGRSWMEFGGVDTLISYGLAPPRLKSDADGWIKLQSDLRQVLPARHIAFLKALRTMFVRGDYAFVHAGVRPGVPLHEQSEADCLWIRGDFTESEFDHGKVIVHGHSPQKFPIRTPVRIGVDTGAYITGKLTAVRLTADEVAFVHTGEKQSKQNAP